ncbi:MAG: DUF192 domain-containing protein [Acidobacteriia bacterium]|nr:DUF192 domain-containing protein [Terriglobia bacterium]
MITFALAIAAALAPVQPVCVAPDGFRVSLELAVTDQERQNGLMFRDSVPADHGMLFLFDVDSRVAFWMKNTFIPLDMIWLSTSGEVVDVHTHVQPCRFDPCPNYEPSRPGRAVLEVNAGFADAHGVRPGSLLQFRDVPGYPAAGGKK